MRAFLGILSLALLVACMPQGPTGNVVAPPTHWVDGGDVLLLAESFSSVVDKKPVRITVKGDLVYDTVFFGGEEHPLSGDSVSDGWLRGEGVTTVYAFPGDYELKGYSCVDSLFGWKCGCVNEDSCGHWMGRVVRVKE